MKPYTAILSAPFATLGVVCSDTQLLGIDFLPAATPWRAPQPATLGAEVARQLDCWLADASFRFDLPCQLAGTPFQERVWRVIAATTRGETISYQQLAARVGSVARAVGGACGRNPLPIIIPCHRVLAKNGLGGFSLSTAQDMLAIKRWLLAHEQQS
ncbi:methylated-DNA--[protein]-cysteine S-methyltransferase [Craterilacuibacter sp.]|uniref:methylated-DNA--[protein]-cysteine S-methyltransferase n=1 Tax=Craterilacuibacter sp. TaxID=2870909 RepID=UPI003F32C987